MPFKSKAQRRKFAELLVTGEITDEQYEEWNRSTGKKMLPERLRPKGTKKKRAAKSRRRVSLLAMQTKTRRSDATKQTRNRSSKSSRWCTPGDGVGGGW